MLQFVSQNEAPLNIGLFFFLVPYRLCDKKNDKNHLIDYFFCYLCVSILNERENEL